ncbi:MAG: sulfotransferase [Planctomycetota bacterium]
MSVLSERLAAPHRQRAVKNPFPWYSPRFWHGMRVSTWLRSLATNHFVVSPSKLPTALSISAFSLGNSIASVTDRLIYGRRVANTELAAPPVFILGHWRAGTTFLHELLIRDPEHTYATTYQCFAPHHFVLTDALVTPWTSILLPRRRPMDNMAAGWQRPQEDEFALGNLGVPTPYTSMMFPNLGPANGSYLDLRDLSHRELELWKRELLRFFQRITFRDPRRIVVKSPPHTARIRILLEMFPDARFVHIVRDPCELFQSTVNLWRSLNEVQRLHTLGDQAWVEEYVLSSHQRMYEAFERDRQQLGEDQLVELHYEDLIEDPIEQLRRVYDQLDLGAFDRVESPLVTYLAQVKNYRRNSYDLTDEQQERVRRRWSGYFARYGYC